MAEHEIVCVERLEAHEHITHVGTGSDDRATARWSVEDVRNAIEDGDMFYTVSPSTEHVAEVEPYDALVKGRIIETIRSTPDAIEDNNLDNMRACRFQS
jgi:hypothetical protein